MAIKVKAHRRGRSIVKAYKRNAKVGRELNRRLRSTSSVTVQGGPASMHAEHSRVKQRLSRQGSRARKQLKALNDKYDVGLRLLKRKSTSYRKNRTISRMLDR